MVESRSSMQPLAVVVGSRRTTIAAENSKASSMCPSRAAVIDVL